MKKAFAPSILALNPNTKMAFANVVNVWFKDGTLKVVDDDYVVITSTFDYDHFKDDDERQAVEDRLLELTKAKYGEKVEQIGWCCGEYNPLA